MLKKIFNVGKIIAPIALKFAPGGQYLVIATQIYGAVKDAQQKYPTPAERGQGYENWVPIGLELIRPWVEKKTKRNMDVGRAINMLRLGREFVLEAMKLFSEAKTKQ